MGCGFSRWWAILVSEDMIGSRLKMHAMESLPNDVVKMLRDHCDLSPATKIILKGDSDYKQTAYQYATTSRRGMAPGAVIYPGCMQDILNVIDHAKAFGIGLALRTGGHQYSGLFFKCLKNSNNTGILLFIP